MPIAIAAFLMFSGVVLSLFSVIGFMGAMFLPVFSKNVEKGLKNALGIFVFSFLGFIVSSVMFYGGLIFGGLELIQAYL